MAASDVPCCETMFWIYLVICVALVSFAGLMSGLTLGLMSLSLVDLEVLAKAGRPQDRRNAEKILPIVKNQHLLLCTLLIGNSLAMEALPIFLDALVPAWGAILISVTLILAFGEIIPQAVCSQYGLSVGAKLSVVVRLLVLVLFPISYPISKLLDWLLGKGHSALLRRAELKTLVDMHGNEAGRGGELTHDETTIISGVLDMTQKTAKDAMTPISEIFSLDINTRLDEDTMSLILNRGHSRIPVFSGSLTNIIGLILVKNLIKCRAEDETPIRNLTIRRIPRVYDCLPLYDILNQFQKGHSHMAVVVKCRKDVKTNTENANTKPCTFAINNSNSRQRQAKNKGVDNQFCPSVQLNISRNVSSESKNPTLKKMMEQGKGASPRLKKWGSGDGNVTDEDLESLPNLDEEVIGIITMEDVMEELLQEEILDETDEYIDVHNKIKINMLPSRRSSSRSPAVALASHLHWRSPVASPLSSCGHTPVLDSPVSPYVYPSFIRPTLSASPGISMPNSPAGLAGPIRSSPSPHRVSRKSYEKIRQPGG
ncbi:hypothetical protein VitviT2T_025152 [Vitis vinifera]|uniref:DUF21 domain-containing protein n=2 Tax=Vitis vinifera TaxID=29760 RepID=A0ABY9DHW6_VITVI|eukprot:XP_002273611.1 PREDICTED: DUF21 domain-containing protein At5g52790 [Vitis vinifera]